MFILRLLALLALPAALSATTPSVRAVTISGAAFDTAAMRNDVIIIHFWATWCAPCRKEMPEIDSYYQAHHAAGVQMIAISMDEPFKAKAVGWATRAFHFPVAMNDKAHYPAAIHPSEMPTTLIYDRAGRLRFDSRKGPADLLTRVKLEQIVIPLLAE